jgi:hypothetical protein
MSTEADLYGLLAEFPDPATLVSAARRLTEAGYQHVEAYSPFHIEALTEVLPVRPWLPWLVLGGGVFGGIGAFVMQYYAAAISYPLNIGGRPLNSWPMFVPITFELTVLAAAFAAVIGMLGLNRLPQPFHPLFKAAHFELATQNRFFLCIEARDSRFDRVATRHLLESLNPCEVSYVYD